MSKQYEFTNGFYVSYNVARRGRNENTILHKGK